MDLHEVWPRRWKKLPAALVVLAATRPIKIRIISRYVNRVAHQLKPIIDGPVSPLYLERVMREHMERFFSRKNIDFLTRKL